MLKYSLFYEIEGNSYLVSAIEGFFFNRDKKKVSVTGRCPLKVSVIEGFK